MKSGAERAAYQRAWREKNPGKCSTYCKTYYKKHPERKHSWRKRDPEKIRAYAKLRAKRDAAYHAKYSKEWQERNREKARGYSRAYRERNPEKERRRRNWYWERNRQKVLALHSAYRARKHGSGGSYTVQEWHQVCERFGGICPACGRKRQLTADHIVPVSKGGSSNIENIQPLCGSCNSRKHNKFIICYLPWRPEGVGMHEDQHKNCAGHGDAGSHRAQLLRVHGTC